MTFANDGGQEPMYCNHPNTGKPGSDFKFTFKYQDVPIEPLYPFGYGSAIQPFATGIWSFQKKRSQWTGRCAVV